MSVTHQIHLSGRVRKHFGIPSGKVWPDTGVEPAREWHACWRIEDVVASSDGSQHLFLATNAASLYSFLLPLDCGAPFEDLVSLFHQHWIDALVGRGVRVPLPLNSATQFLRGRPASLIGSMNELVYHAQLHICEDGCDIKTTHRRIRHMPMKKGKDYIFPDQEFDRLLQSDPPFPGPAAGESSSILPFPS
jgi:hypothetical protein